MKHRKAYWMTVLILGIALIAISCQRSGAEPTPNLSLIVAQTQTSIAIDQILTATAFNPTPTDTEVSPVQAPQETASVTSGSACSNQAEYISETVPDNSTFRPGENFEKIWRLRNAGTCTWNTSYALVFDGGDKMGGVDSVWLSSDVPPGNQLEISVPLTAPQEPGEHQGFWKLQNEIGERFGLGENSDVAFWVKIVVQESETTSNLGNPSWESNFTDSKAPFYLGADENLDFEVEDGQLNMTAVKSAGDQWRIAQLGYLEDFYLEAVFTTGKTCAGKDSYGLLVRAPDQPDSIIDSGYVFVVSCDGSFRVYLMQNGSYNSIINWASAPSIKTGANQTNRVAVRAEGTKLQMVINDVKVTEFFDGTYPMGYFGLSVRSEGSVNFTVAVQNIAYWILNQ